MKTGIVGGGIAGLCSAWFLLERGHEVRLFDKGKCGRGCTWASAGMLAPAQEIDFQEPEISAAGKAGLEIYFQLEKILGNIGLIKHGTLELALEQDDLGYLKRLFDFQLEQGMKVQWLSGNEAREIEPFLSNRIPAAILATDDIQIDHRFFIGVLIDSLKRKGAIIHEDEELISYRSDNGKVFVKTIAGEYDFDKILLATGTGKVIKQEYPFQVYPVRGEMISFELPHFEFLKKNIRIRNKTLGYGYIIPKKEMIIAGSTMEEKGFVQKNTGGGLLDILRKAYAAVPGIYELTVKETWAGLRPATINRLPVIQEEEGKNVFHLNGLFRHGIMLGPFAGKTIAALMTDGERNPLAEKFLW